MNSIGLVPEALVNRLNPMDELSRVLRALIMYYNGLVIFHKRNINFLAENDNVVVGNFRYTWSQVSFVYVCVCVFPHLCVYTLIKLGTLS